MFIDPAGQYQFELPLGWGYDPEQSHLITVMFKHWEHPNEILSVRAMPTFAPPHTSSQEWYKVLEEHCFPPQMRPFVQMKCGNMPAALAEAHETDPKKVHRRILVVRGIRIDIIAEHRVSEPSTDSALSEVLSTICRSLQVPTNWSLPELSQQEEVESDLQQALEALQRQARDEALTLLLGVQRAAQSTYLYSLVNNTPLPEIPAIIALIDALVYMGSAQITVSLLHLRDAEHLALRALHTLNGLYLPHVGKMYEALTERLSEIINLQITVAKEEEEWAKRYPPSPGFGLSLLRVDPLLEQARQFYLGGQPTLALKPCEVAIADLMTVLSVINTSAPIEAPSLPPELVGKLELAGARTPVDQMELIQEISQRFFYERLTLMNSLSLLSDMKAFSGDVVGAKKAVEFFVEITEKKLGETKNLQSLKSQQKRLTAAWIQLAGRLVEMGDKSSLEEAKKYLDKAEEQLDQIGEEGILRAWLCLIQASLLHSQRCVQGAIEIIDRGLRATAGEPQHSELYVRELKTIKSQFLMHEGKLQEARDIALEVIELSEGSDPRDCLDRSGHYLNLGIINRKLGNLQESAENLCAALYKVIEVSPFGEAAVRILYSASELYLENNLALCYQLKLAATVALDARRVIIGADQFRIDFDEATLRRETYESLIEFLLECGMGKEALAVADRYRARSLNELLAIPESELERSIPSHSSPPLPLLDAENVEQSLLKGVEYIIEKASIVMYQHGAIPPLHADEIEALAKELGAPALIIQPMRSHVTLLLVQPSGQVEVRFSPLSVDELLKLVDEVQKQFRIFSVPRGESENEHSTSPSENASEAYTKLWRALIEPINEFLVNGESLVIVPYREFTLVPFALLVSPEGHPLIEHHSLSIVPSLATLRMLRERGAWTRTRPLKAYIVGDPPARPPKKRPLKRLPAARQEAEAVAASLKAAGMREENIILRLDDAAHEESYRSEARGCDLVHLSCHASLEEPAYESRLYFAPYDQHDGLLLVSEIAEVKLNDALVFLAACETGQGRPTADSIIGIGRAFLEAGARAVILSLWKVEDAATAALSRHFYHALLQADTPYNVSEALRLAMLSTRAELEAGSILTKDQQPLKPDSLNWAPFFVLGDGLSVCYRQ